MNSSNEVELVREFAEGRSERAFSELVQRYSGLVYSVGCRITGSPDLTRDVTQSVFIDLAGKIAQIRSLLGREPSPESARAMLAGWLHRAVTIVISVRRRADSPASL